MTRPLTRFTHTVVAAGLALALAACGDDGTAGPAGTSPRVTDPAATGTPATGPATTTEPQVTTAASDPSAFCRAELEVETAIMNEADPSAAISAAVAAAPPDVAPALDTVLAEFQANGGESEAFDEAYGEMVDWMKGNCGYGTIEATATEYAFAGIPEEVPAGPTIVSLTNVGKEFHELLLLRKNDGVTESFDELMAIEDEQETFAKTTVVGVAFAPNGAVGHAVSALSPGDYLAICFLPTGATPEVMAQMSGPDSSLPPGAGPPHFTHGMHFEFTVTD